MTERLEEFKENCLGDEEGARRVDGADRSREAERYLNQANYHLKAAEELLESDAELISIVEGYYSMLHKANQALALAGFKADSHKCTLLGLRGVFGKSDLAGDLQAAGDERLNVDYFMNPEKPDLDYTEPKNFIKETVKPFLEELDSLIDEEDLD